MNITELKNELSDSRMFPETEVRCEDSDDRIIDFHIVHDVTGKRAVIIKLHEACPDCQACAESMRDELKEIETVIESLKTEHEPKDLVGVLEGVIERLNEII